MEIGVKSSGARKSFDSKMVDVQIAVHKLMLSWVMTALSMSGFELAMVGNMRSNRMTCGSSFDVYSAMVATKLGLAGRCRGPVLCEAAPWVVSGRGGTRLGGYPPGSAGGGRNAGLRGSRLTVFPRCMSSRCGVFSCARMDVVHKMRQRRRQPLGWECERGDGGLKAAVLVRDS